MKRFSENLAKFYATCVILAIGFLHQNNYIYRDLKLENILLDEFGYIKVSDFGLAKFLPDTEKALTFCGTPEYLAPEIILGLGHNKSADWWTVGIFIYEMVYGLPPFYSHNHNELYRKIVKDDINFRSNVKLSYNCKDLIFWLLQKHSKKRIGT